MSYREEITRVFRQEGWIGFTRGYTAMLCRDSPGFGLYFCLFEAFKKATGIPSLEHRLHEEGKHTSTELIVKKFLVGGIAGCITWTFCYPMDTVKSKMQTYQGTDRLKLRTVVRQVALEQGVSKLYRGIHVQLLRAFPSTATSLLIYETVSESLARQ
jgi:solute carrier family 25 carnitine/acylcarnitine transporter 20/29